MFDISQAQGIIGVGLSGGVGRRSRPLTLKAAGYLRSKGAVRLLGKRVINWIIDALKQQGVTTYLMVTKGKENRYQVKRLIGYGEHLGINVRYSHSRFDKLDHGSADATIMNLEHFRIEQPAFVFPMDSIIDIDLAACVKQHERTGAIITVCVTEVPASQVVDTYGVIVADETRRVVEFVEKPGPARAVELQEQTSTDRLLINAGFYLVDSKALRELGHEREIRKMRETSLDFGRDLLPWLVRQGRPVYVFPVERVGDLGNIPAYLDTMLRVLRGEFRSAQATLGPPTFPERQVWVEPETLHAKDPWSGKTLAERMKSGEVHIGPRVRIGKYVQIAAGVTLEECNVDDECEIYANATIRRSSIGEGSIVGPFAVVEDSVTGVMVEIQSSKGARTHIEGYTAVGDEVTIRAGVHLEDHVLVYPRLKIPRGCRISAHAELTCSDDVMRWL